MIAQSDIVSYIPTSEELRLLKTNAEAAMLGGVSQIYKGEDRQRNLFDNQFHGQMGELSLAKYLFGSIDQYVKSRELRNSDPWKGDMGNDYPDYPGIDAKTSFMRASSDPLRYRLPIRAKERYIDHIYISCLIQKYEDRFQVFMVGCIEDSMLPSMPETSGIFSGAYTIPNQALPCTLGTLKILCKETLDIPAEMR